MSNDILSVLYDAYVSNGFDGIQALNFKDLQAAYADLHEFEKKHDVSLSECNHLEANIINEMTNISEQKGFINGFKLAVRLFAGK